MCSTEYGRWRKGTATIWLPSGEQQVRLAAAGAFVRLCECVVLKSSQSPFAAESTRAPGRLLRAAAQKEPCEFAGARQKGKGPPAKGIESGFGRGGCASPGVRGELAL